jgi:hypothetical protein
MANLLKRKPARQLPVLPGHHTPLFPLSQVNLAIMLIYFASWCNFSDSDPYRTSEILRLPNCSQVTEPFS